MIEEIVRNHLLNVLEYIPCTFERDPEPPDTYCLIEVTGQRKDQHITHSTIAIQSYAESLYDAAVLDDLVCDAMEQAIALDEICKVTLNASYNFTDPTTKEYRYQSVFDIVHY